MKRPAGVVFDKDGTLFDFEATWVGWCHAFLDELASGDGKRLLALADAVGFDAQAGRFLPGSPVIADPPDVIAACLLPHLPGWTQASLVTRMNARAELAPQVPVVPLAPLFDRLAARGLALGLVTNDGMAPARAHLEGAGILHRFAFVAGFDSGHGRKPAPDPLLAFAKAVGLPPARIAMVGDSAHDMVAGRAAGMTCVAVQSGQTPGDVLAPLADVVLPDIGALEDWIDTVA